MTRWQAKAQVDLPPLHIVQMVAELDALEYALSNVDSAKWQLTKLVHAKRAALRTAERALRNGA